MDKSLVPSALGLLNLKTSVYAMTSRLLQDKLFQIISRAGYKYQKTLYIKRKHLYIKRKLRGKNICATKYGMWNDQQEQGFGTRMFESMLKCE